MIKVVSIPQRPVEVLTLVAAASIPALVVASTTEPVALMLEPEDLGTAPQVAGSMLAQKECGKDQATKHWTIY